MTDPVQVLYCDNHLLALDKPGGLLTQPSGTDQDSLEAQGKQWLKEKFSKPGAVFLEAVHRIDRVACGVVLFARTSKALSRLNQAVRTGGCVKIYHVLVERSPREASGTLRHWMVHDDHCAKLCAPGAPGGREALLDYRVLTGNRPDGLVMLEVRLHSGRYHQIRLQLSAEGMPIVGDSLYGSRRNYRPGAIALQHYSLEIRHPVTHEVIRFVANGEL